MQANWLNETLCSFDEKTRIELGPQLIELECTHANLRDEVTAPHYRIGQRDALGKIIMPELIKDPKKVDDAKTDHFGCVHEGETMTCVDWREKHLPKVWKIYKLVYTGEVYVNDAREDEAGEHKKGDPILTFVKVGEDENKDDALDFAKALAGEM